MEDGLSDLLYIDLGRSSPTPRIHMRGRGIYLPILYIVFVTRILHTWMRLDEIISKGVEWNNSRADLVGPQMLKQEHERTTTTSNFVSQRLG